MLVCVRCIFKLTHKHLLIEECLAGTVAGTATEVADVVGTFASPAAVAVVFVVAAVATVVAVVVTVAAAVGSAGSVGAVVAAVATGSADWLVARCRSGCPADWSSFCKY